LKNQQSLPTGWSHHKWGNLHYAYPGIKIPRSFGLYWSQFSNPQQWMRSQRKYICLPSSYQNCCRLWL